MTERAQREAGRRAKTVRFDMRRKGKAVGVGETAGSINVGVEAETDRLFGAAVPANDGELDLMNAGALYQAHSVESAGVDHA
jgi:pyruvate/2-oxoglutarate dehydrogenase complex dihydrolipoamide dehydrogenase (E3) component